MTLKKEIKERSKVGMILNWKKEANEFAIELLSYDIQEISYDLVKNCDLGLEVMEELKRFKK